MYNKEAFLKERRQTLTDALLLYPVFLSVTWKGHNSKSFSRYSCPS